MKKFSLLKMFIDIVPVWNNTLTLDVLVDYAREIQIKICF